MKALDAEPGSRERRVELLERSRFLSVFEGALGEAIAGRGRVVLVRGEAGVGKTALLREFCARPLSCRVLWAACERLFTPRALGPFLDICESVGGELAGVAGRGVTAHELLVGLVGELRREGPTGPLG